MSVTAQQVFDIVMDLADERDIDGTIDETRTKSYSVRTPGLLTSIQSSLIQEGRYTKTIFKSIAKPVTILSGFDVVIHKTEDVTIEATGQCYGYAFTATGTGTVYIEDNVGGWTTLATINCVADTEYTGAITPTPGATQSRIRLSGSFAFGILNYALYEASYPTVPSYAAKILVEMPDDYNSVKEIVVEEGGAYSQNKPFEFEDNGDLYVDIDFEGILKVVYYPELTPITALTDALVLSDRLCRSTVAYMLGMELFKEENDIFYGHFREMYRDTKTMNKVPKKGNVGAVYDEYGGF